MKFDWIALHPQVRIVNGFRRAAFYDLQREQFFYVRSAIADWLGQALPCPEAQVQDFISTQYERGSDYLNWLVDKEILFRLPASMAERFKDISLDFGHPGELLSATIPSELVNVDVIAAICSAGARHLAIDCRSSEVDGVLSVVDAVPLAMPLLSVTLRAGRRTAAQELQIREKAESRYCVTNVVFDGGEVEDSIPAETEPGCQGRKDGSNPRPPMRCNLHHYLVALKSNVAFYRHAHIHSDGTIYEGEGTEVLIGQLGSPPTKSDFTSRRSVSEVQNASKDRTDICCHCEHRYMCGDLRVPRKREGGLWYHDMECAYNPYIALWRGEKYYRNLAECGVTSDAHTFSIDHVKIAAINKEIWGE